MDVAPSIEPQNLFATPLELQSNSIQQRLQHDSQQLATGLTINAPQDGPALFAIAQKMQSAINGYDQGSRNIQEATNQLQVAGGALQSITAAVQQIRALAVEASSSLLSPSDLAAIQSEINQLTEEVNTIAGDTSFEGSPIFQASTTSYSAPTIAQSSSLTNVVRNHVTFNLATTPTPGHLLLAFLSIGNKNGGTAPAPIITPQLAGLNYPT